MEVQSERTLDDARVLDAVLVEVRHPFLEFVPLPGVRPGVRASPSLDMLRVQLFVPPSVGSGRKPAEAVPSSAGFEHD